MTDIILVQSQIAELVDSMKADKEVVQVAAVVGGVAIAITALIVDGDIGYAMSTGILTLAGTVSGYWWGSKGASR